MNTTNINDQFKKTIFTLVLVLLFFSTIEILFRLTIVKTNNTSSFLGKYWYTLLPLELPDSTYLTQHNITHPDAYRIYDPMLGWKLASNRKAPPYYYSSLEGFRITKEEFQKKSITKKADYMTIGDSFTHGVAVYCEESWPYLFGELKQKKVVNYGIPGYGIDQAILSYMYSPVEADTIILGIIPGDFERATNIVYGGIYRGGNKSKPMFVFRDDGKYEIKNQPSLVGIDLWNEFKLGTNSNILRFEKSYDDLLFKKEFLDNLVTHKIYKMFKYRYKYINLPIYLKKYQDDNYIYILKILGIFFEECQKNQDFPIILLLDNKNTFADRINYTNPWGNVINDLKEMGFFVVDPLESIVEMYTNDPKSIINNDGMHYTPLANKMIADHLLENIDQMKNSK